MGKVHCGFPRYDQGSSDAIRGEEHLQLLRWLVPMGDITHEEASRSMELFVSEVMLHVAESNVGVGAEQ